MFVYAFSFFMVLWNSGKNFMDKILHCFTYNVPKKKRFTSNSVALTIPFYLQIL